MASYLKRFLLFSIPFILVLIVYVIYDPFMVLYRYDDYNKRIYLPKNRDFVSTEVYINNYRKHKYDSFIFGTSTALFITPTMWKNYLDSMSSVFSFDASRENMIGIWSKIKYIDKLNQPIRNALLVLDYDKAFGDLDKKNVLFTKHYKVYSSSVIDFQTKNFLNFLNPLFLRAFIMHNITGKFKPYMDEYLVEEDSYIDPVTNEFFSISVRNELKIDSVGYYQARKSKFPLRSGTFFEYKSQISDEQIKMLEEIREIFIRDGTVYRIIISPNYKQASFNRADLDALYSIFGKENVLDFSGINSISDEMSNFYDALHFKTYVGKQLLDMAYSGTRNE